MKTLRLKNIRSLGDTGPLDIKPITILLGKNSSGKSTFLRTFPLLKQSIGTRTSTPILWYGDHVDFGSVKEAKSSFSGEEGISIEMTFPYSDIGNHIYYFPVASIPTNDIQSYGLNDITYSVELHEVSGRTKLKKVTVKIKSDDDLDKIELVFDNNKAGFFIFINGCDFSHVLQDSNFQITLEQLIPIIIVNNVNYFQYAYANQFSNSDVGIDRLIRTLFSQNIRGNVSEKTLKRIATSFQYSGKKHFKQKVLQRPSTLRNWPKFLELLSTEYGESLLENIRYHYLVKYMPSLFEGLSRYMYLMSNNISYIGPSRATGQRYYRFQELAVDRIDPKGENIAMFLYSLSEEDQGLFSSWFLEKIGYEVKVERIGGHVQLLLSDMGRQHFHNISDMGYGFSQIIPIMAQIWINQKKTSPYAGLQNTYVAIEQPELHLHPAYQARIADSLSGAIQAASALRSEKNLPPNLFFIVETHSESLINKIGELIFQQQISAKDVAIYIFEKDCNSERTNVRKSSFDTDGILNDWPIDFFSTL